MDTQSPYGTIIKDVIREYAKLRPSHGSIRLDTVFDEEQGHYALMQAGWDRDVRIRGNLIYITVESGRVFVEYDGIEHGIVDELCQRGIPKENISLAYLSPDREEQLIPA